MKKNRRLLRLKRKVRESETRVNKRIHARMDEMRKDEDLMKEIDQEIDLKGPEAIMRGE